MDPSTSFSPYRASVARCAPTSFLDALYCREYAGNSTAGLRQPFSVGGVLAQYTSSCRSLSWYSTTVDIDNPPLTSSFGAVRTDRLAVATEGGAVAVYNTEKVNTRESLPIAELHAHDNSVFDLEWCDGDEKLATASGDHSICVWDVEQGRCTEALLGHKASVKSVSARPNDPYVFTSSSRDGSAMVWDRRASPLAGGPRGSFIRPAHKLCDIHRAPSSRAGSGMSISVTCSLFLHDNLLATCGASDGLVKVWDMRRIGAVLASPMATLRPHSVCEPESARGRGVSWMSADRRQSRIAVTMSDSSTFVYRIADMQGAPLLHARSERPNRSFYIRSALSTDGDYLAVGSAANSANVWEVDGPGRERRQWVLSGHDGEVVHVSWSSDRLPLLATASDDGHVRVWSHENQRRDSYLHWDGSAQQTTYWEPYVQEEQAPPSPSRSSPTRGSSAHSAEQHASPVVSTSNQLGIRRFFVSPTSVLGALHPAEERPIKGRRLRL